MTEHQQQAHIGLPWWLCGKESTCNAGDTKDSCSVPGLGRFPGGEHGNPLQYSYLENPMDNGAWPATVHRVTRSQTWVKRLSTHVPSSNLVLIRYSVWEKIDTNIGQKRLYKTKCYSPEFELKVWIQGTFDLINKNLSFIHRNVLKSNPWTVVLK